jgi:hypothetical protein
MMSNITAVPIDQPAGILIRLTFGLCHDTNGPGARVYHAAHPQSTTSDSHLPTVKKTFKNTLAAGPTSAAKDIKMILFQNGSSFCKEPLFLK